MSQTELAKWIKNREVLIEMLKNLNPEDRMGHHASMTSCNQAMYTSVKGWANWLSDAITMSKFDDKNLEEMYKEFYDITLKFLKFDKKWSNELDKKQTEETKKATETTYID